MKKLLKWTLPPLIFILLAAAGIGALYWVAANRQAPEQAAAPSAADVEASKPEPKDATATPSVILTNDQIQTAGIKTTALADSTLQPEIRLFGMLEEDPSATFTLRAAVPGNITASGGGWPEMGQTIADNATIGQLEPRLAPADKLALEAQRVSLETQLSTCHSDMASAASALAAARASLDRLKILNAQDKNVSDRAVEEAAVKVQDEQSRLDAATRNSQVCQAALAAAAGKLVPIPLVIDRGGEVAEVLAQPGEAVESGQSILRITRADRLLAHIDLPAEQPLPVGAQTVRLIPLGHEDRPLAGTRAGTAAAADPKTHGRILLFRTQVGQTDIRPGTPVIAYLPLAGETLKGTTIPRAAVIHFGGKPWAYLSPYSGTFKRREISLDHPVADGWFVTADFKPGDQVVIVGAQTLLSHEINAAF